MIGAAPTVKDIDLYPVDNIDLSCPETLSLEVEPTKYPFKIAGECVGCRCRIVLYVCSTRSGILQLQQQLFDDLGIFCGTCGRGSFRYGERKRR